MGGEPSRAVQAVCDAQELLLQARRLISRALSLVAWENREALDPWTRVQELTACGVSEQDITELYSYWRAYKALDST
jgi:hypothetical protein